MNEIYRSFEGKLSPDQQEGYIVYESDSFYEIHILSVWKEGKQRYRIGKKDLPIQFDWKDNSAVYDLLAEIFSRQRKGKKLSSR